MIKITEKAAIEIKRLMESEKLNDSFRLRPSIIGSGCHGLSYNLGFSSGVNNNYLEDEQYGIKIVVDNKSNLYLNECILDFVSDNLMQRGFVFKNPNAKSTCGCGQSFS